MSDNILLDKEILLNEELIKEKLNKAFLFFIEINKITNGYIKEWKYYGKKYGWKYKIYKDKKTLLELTVFNECFLIGMAIRKNEWEDLKKENINEDLKNLILQANIFPEGYGIKIKVQKQNDFENIKFLINYIMIKRKK